MTAQATSSAELRGHRAAVAEQPAASMIIVGKDVIELLSSAMYVDPLSIYREYIQNAADAIDDARAAGFLDDGSSGQVTIRIDPESRSLTIRDNGIGLGVAEAPAKLLAIGASAKRGTQARGFRGVGRLAGLAYARSLTFRTRTAGDDEVIELHWDCQRLKAALREVDEKDDIASVIKRVVTLKRLPGADWPDHFFEVQLSDVIRTKRDCLLSPKLVREYLEQVAPVPFDANFSWGPRITEHLSSVRVGNLSILIDGEAEPITRPFRDTFKVSETLEDRFSELEFVTLGDLDGGLAAVGWVLHHAYLGSITVRSRVGGLRTRIGNVQVGSEDLLADIFPETRFNGWAVGEIHVLDPRILPNARRDNFEQNVHYSNLTAQLEPIARQVARRARTASITRNQEKRAAAAQSPIELPDESTERPAVSHPRTGGSLSPAQKGFLRKVRSLAARCNLSDAEVRHALRQV
jgi:molecular chaperone HtpG